MNYRIIDGEHKDEEGTLIEDHISMCLISIGKDREVWVPKSKLEKLECMILNCRTYSGYPQHEYCRDCKPKGKQDISPLDRVEKMNKIAQDNLGFKINPDDVPGLLKILADSDDPNITSIAKQCMDMEEGKVQPNREFCEEMIQNLYNIAKDSPFIPQEYRDHLKELADDLKMKLDDI